MKIGNRNCILENGSSNDVRRVLMAQMGSIGKVNKAFAIERKKDKWSVFIHGEELNTKMGCVANVEGILQFVEGLMENDIDVTIYLKLEGCLGLGDWLYRFETKHT